MATVTLHCSDGQDVLFDRDLLFFHSKVFTDMLSIPTASADEDESPSCSVSEDSHYLKMLRRVLTREHYDIGAGIDAQAFAHLCDKYEILYGKRVVSDQAWRWTNEHGNAMSLRAFTCAAIVGNRPCMNFAAQVSLPLAEMNLRRELSGCPPEYVQRLLKFHQDRLTYARRNLASPDATPIVMPPTARKKDRCVHGNLQHADAHLWNTAAMEVIRNLRPCTVPRDAMQPKVMEMVKEVRGCSSCIDRLMGWLKQLEDEWHPPTKIEHPPLAPRTPDTPPTTVFLDLETLGNDVFVF